MDETLHHEAERITQRPRPFARTSRRLTGWVGSLGWVLTICAAAFGWVVLGMVSDYPRWWELVVTVGFPFLTLLLLALVQHTQNHSANAIELKLDELLFALGPASDAMVRIEEASEADLRRLQDHFQERSEAIRVVED